MADTGYPPAAAAPPEAPALEAADVAEQALPRRARHEEAGSKEATAQEATAPPDAVDGAVLDASGPPTGEVKPCLCYFPFAGRGELSRLIAAVGGLEIDEVPEVEDKASFGSPGSLPVLVHRELKIAQSFAIEQYIASIAPGFSNLDSAQRALDGMFCKIKDDVLRGFADVLAGIIGDESKKEIAAADIAAVGDKWFPIVEGRLPEDGFIHLLDFPTAGDLAVFNMAKAFMPFGAAYGIAEYDVAAKFPKFAAHALRVSEHSTVAAYLERTTTMAADPFSLRKPSTQGQAKAQEISELAVETAELWHAVDCPVPDCAVVWLHGLGETEVYYQELFDMENLLELKELGEVRWIMPRAQPGPCTARGGAHTFQWFDTPEYPVCMIVPGIPDHLRKDEDPIDIHKAVHLVHEAVLALEVEGVPADRIVVGGFGQGAALAVHAAVSYPKTLAGCAMLSGYVPCKAKLAEVATPAAAGLEILWLHGIHDAVVHTDVATVQAKALEELGIRLDFRLSFDFGHEMISEELQFLRAWLINRMKLPEPVEEVVEEVAEPPSVPPSRPVSKNVIRQDPWGAPNRRPSESG